jgi:hypothetical protein
MGLDSEELQVWITLQTGAPAKSILHALRTAREYALDLLQEEVLVTKYDKGWQVSVSADGAAPPAAGKIGNTLKANTAPVTAVNETASVVFGADSATPQIISNREPVAPQSCNSSSVKVHCLSTDL